MTKSPEAKLNYTLRREMRLRRDKTAALLMPWFLSLVQARLPTGSPEYLCKHAAESAVAAADALLAELDRTAPELALLSQEKGGAEP